MILQSPITGVIRLSARVNVVERGQDARTRNSSGRATSPCCCQPSARAARARDLADDAAMGALAGALEGSPARGAAALRTPSSRAKRVSLGALAALTVGPTAGVAGGWERVGGGGPNRPRRPNTHRDRAGQRRPPGAAAPAGARRRQRRRHLRPRNRSRGSQLPVITRPRGRRDCRSADQRSSARGTAGAVHLLPT